MEKVLGNIATTAGSKFSKVKDAANLAKEQIACPNLPIHTHREKCLATVELALDTAHPKLSVLAVEALQLCMLTYGSSDEPSVRLAVRASITQMLNSFCSNLYAQAEEDSQDELAIFMDMTTLINDCVKKLDQLSRSTEQSVIVLEAIYSILSTQPLQILKYQPFNNAIWRDLCPCLMKLWGVPEKSSPCVVGRSRPSNDEPVGQGQIAGQFQSAARNIFETPDMARALYQILEQLVRLMATHEEMQSILQALFHKALLFPVVPQRLEALKVIKRIFGDQDRVIDLIRITVTNGSFIFWKLFLDCLVECSRCQTLDVTMEASRAADVLLESLEKMCSEMSGLPEDLKIKLLKMETFDNTVFHYEGNDLPDLKDKTPAAGSTSDSSDSEEEQMKRGLYESKEVINQRLQRLKQGMQRVPSLDPDVPPAPRSHRTDSQMAEDESLSSRRFMEKLADHYAVWLELKSSIEVDEHIQQFAADFYKEFTDEQKKVFDKHSLQPNQFLNGDALYLTVYAALCVARYGRTVNKEWFVKQVVGCGCIVYVSESWLGLVYDDVSKKAFFSLEGKANCALFEALEDFCGVGAQMMSAEQKLAKIANRNHVCDESLAVRKWTKALLNSSWEGLIVVLSRFLLGKEKKKSKATNSKVIRGTQVSLHALQSLCRLLIQLDMGSRSGWIFEKLVENVCPLEELRVLSGIDDRSSSSWQMDRIDKWRVSKQDALSLEMVLDNAVDCGLASSTCWKHVIRCTEYLWELERYLFGSGGAEERKTSRWSLLGRDTSTQFNMVNLMSQSNEMLSPEEQPLCGLFESSGEENLDAVGTAKVLCVLIAKAEKFYEKVGKWLNLDSLCQFMKSLVLASENRLRNSNFNSKMTDPCTLINRIALIILKIASRPLVHLMKVWPTITNHFIEAACTRDQEQLTCAAISCLHDCQNALLIQEPNGFCFNQMLFVPLQTILCIDMSSEETQDQIVSALSSFVHLSSEKIGSGWRPLFGALKAIRTSPLNNASHLSSVHATVLDVFSTFLDIRNPNILSLTMYECINCLLHYLQATALESEAADTNRIEAQDNALGESAFLNLQKIDHILQKFFSIEMAPVPALLHRLVLRERSGDCMDATLTLFDDVVPELSAVIADSDTAETDPSPLELDKKVEVPFPPFPWKELGLSQRCTAELYLSLIEGLTGVVVTCPRMLQSRIFQHISTTTTNLIGSKAGLEFGAYSLSALILPMLQKWLRREMLSDGWRDNTSNARNFKQAVGMFTEVVVDYVKADNENAWCNRILLDLFILLSECVSQPSEIIARLGCSCLKHLIVSAGGHFTETQWTIAVHSLWKTTCICLHPIRRLMYHFFVSSTDYNGDVGNVQIALRQDSTSGEAARIKIIAHQVFLLDSQQSVPDAELHSPDLFSQADRSVVFVLNLDKSGDASSEEHVVKLPFRDIVISLLSQQLILQLLASILISEPSNCIPSGTSSLLRSIIAEPEQLGSKLSRRSISTLFHCLDSSFQIAHEFDSRPGLKFLVQKVLNADVAANLYKQMVTAYTIKALVLYGLARRNNGDLNDRKKFGRSLEKLCAQLGKLEKSTAEDKIAVLMRETVPQEVDFVLKEVSATETEQVFRIVSKQEVDGSLEEYKRHKKQSLPPSHPIRANPFAGASAALQEEQKIIDEQQTKSRLKDADVRIAAFVEMVLASFELLQAEDDDTFKMLLPMFYTSIALANRNSANLRIRTFVSDFFEKLDGVYALCDK
uniref:SEC7 domain-containing protein n=1 Tax=Steinernema glaseri TaxID=37863 RepID=A0A1I7ZTA7_9BILA